MRENLVGFDNREPVEKEFDSRANEYLRTVEALEVPEARRKSVLATASNLTRTIIEEKINKGNGSDTCFYGAIFSALRHHDVPVHYKEFSKLSGVRPSRLKSIHKRLCRSENSPIDYSPVSIRSWVDKYFNYLYGGNEEAVKTKERILQTVESHEELGLSAGRSERITAASILYLVYVFNQDELNVTQDALSRLYNASKVSIRKNYQNILEKTNLSP